MYKPVQQCTHCGAGLSLDDLRKPNCTYCGTVFPHHAQAAQHAQVVGQVMGQMMQQQGQLLDQYRGAFGVPPIGGGPPGGPPPGGAGYGPGFPPPPGAHGSPYGDPMRMAQLQMQQTQAVAGRIMTFVILGVVASFIVVMIVVGAILAR